MFCKNKNDEESLAEKVKKLADIIGEQPHSGWFLCEGSETKGSGILRDISDLKKMIHALEKYLGIIWQEECTKGYVKPKKSKAKKNKHD